MRLLFVLFIIITLAADFASAAKEEPPIKTVSVTPVEFSRDTDLIIEPILNDPDAQYIFEYRWFINDEEVLGEISDIFPGELLQRGDLLSIEVTPLTPEGETLEPFVSLPLETKNAPPHITSEPAELLGKTSYTYQVTARDADEDALHYQLDEGPEGMTIDEETGLLSWTFEEMPQGDFSVTVVVTDDFGGKDAQTFSLNLSLVQREK
ncbi:MAG: putative Ig domain-containing protein [Desulfuromonadaceae bacterium]|nr:putative Ig domain-containing protein [Desulfuromonadaceae bacterium]